jgi:NifU-like protein involved in Fe-S cluster formation
MPPALPEPAWTLFRDLPGLGELAPGPGVIHGRAGSRRAGGEVRFSLALSAGTVREARFQAWGCPWTLALAAAACAELPGLTRAELEGWSAAGLAERLALPPERRGVGLLIEDALRRAGQAPLEGT